MAICTPLIRLFWPLSLCHFNILFDQFIYLRRLFPFKVNQSRASLVAQWLANAVDTGLGPGPGGACVPQSNWACAMQLLSLRSGARLPQLLSPRATTAEAHAPGACAPQRRGGRRHDEDPAHRTRSGPCSLQLGRARGQQRRSNAAKNKINKFKKM